MRKSTTGLAVLAAGAAVFMAASPAFAATSTITITNGTLTSGGGTATKLVSMTVKDTVSGSTETCANASGTFSAPSGVTHGTYPFQPTGTVINTLKPFPAGGSCTGTDTFPNVTITLPAGGAPLFVTGDTNAAGQTPGYVQGVQVTASTGTGCTVSLDGPTAGTGQVPGTIDEGVKGAPTHNWLVLAGSGGTMRITAIAGCGTLGSVGDPVTVAGRFTINSNNTAGPLTVVATTP